MKNLVGLLGAVVFVMVLVLGTTAEATPGTPRMYSFGDFGDFSTFQYLQMSLAANFVPNDSLLIRVDGVDKPVVDTDYSTGSWHLGLTNDLGFVVGWASNSLKADAGYEGWLTGKYSGAPDQYNGSGGLVYTGLTYGGVPTHLFLVYDSRVDLNLDGYGVGWDVIGGQVGSLADVADGDLFFREDSILFGPVGSGLRGNLLEGIGGFFPPCYASTSGGVPAIMPHMVVIPEPATMLLLGVGGLFLRKRFVA